MLSIQGLFDILYVCTDLRILDGRLVALVVEPDVLRPVRRSYSDGGHHRARP